MKQIKSIEDKHVTQKFVEWYKKINKNAPLSIYSIYRAGWRDAEQEEFIQFENEFLIILPNKTITCKAVCSPMSMDFFEIKRELYDYAEKHGGKLYISAK